MNYMDFNPYLTQELHQQMQREVNSLRLHKRLRDDRKWATRGSLPSLIASRVRSNLTRLRTAPEVVQANQGKRISLDEVVSDELRGTRMFDDQLLIGRAETSKDAK